MNSENVVRVTKVSSNESRGCEHCDFSIDNESVSASINHYIAAHHYRILHVGTETIGDGNGGPWHTTVAILGCDDPPKVLERKIAFPPGLVDPE